MNTSRSILKLLYQIKYDKKSYSKSDIVTFNYGINKLYNKYVIGFVFNNVHDIYSNIKHSTIKYHLYDTHMSVKMHEIQVKI